MSKVYKAAGYIRFFGQYDFLIIVDKHTDRELNIEYYQIEVSNLITMENDIIPTKFKDFKIACDYAEELSDTLKRAALITDNKILLTTNKMRNS